MKTSLVFAALAVVASSQAATLITIDFQDLGGGSGSIGSAYHNIDGVTFKNFGYLTNSAGNYYLNATTYGYAGYTPNTSASIVFTTPAIVSNVDIKDYSNAAVTVIPSSTSSAVTVTGISTTTSTSLDLTSYGAVSEIDFAGRGPVLDNLKYTPVPEPMTMLALAGGLVALARRRKQS